MPVAHYTGAPEVKSSGSGSDAVLRERMLREPKWDETEDGRVLTVSLAMFLSGCSSARSRNFLRRKHAASQRWRSAR
jgi:hypothetical protein